MHTHLIPLLLLAVACGGAQQRDASPVNFLETSSAQASEHPQVMGGAHRTVDRARISGERMPTHDQEVQAPAQDASLPDVRLNGETRQRLAEQQARQLAGMGLGEGTTFPLVDVGQSWPMGSGVMSTHEVPDGLTLGASAVDLLHRRYFFEGRNQGSTDIHEVNLATGDVVVHPSVEMGNMEYDPAHDAVVGMHANTLVRLSLADNSVEEIARFDGLGVAQGSSAYDVAGHRYFMSAGPVEASADAQRVFAVDVQSGEVQSFASRLQNFAYRGATDSLVGIVGGPAIVIAELSLADGTQRVGRPLRSVYMGSSTISPDGRFYFTQGGVSALEARLMVFDVGTLSLLGTVQTRACNGIEYTGISNPQ